MEQRFTITVNGTDHELTTDPDRSLLDVLRTDLGITGPKAGCGEGACGACTVLLGRRSVTACVLPVAEAAGQRVTTVEGLAEDGLLHPVQQAWLETGAMQCGYCTAGWLTAGAALLNRVPHPDDARITAELSGNVCRCCTYPRILAAVHRAAELMEHPELLAPAGLRAGSAPVSAAVSAGGEGLVVLADAIGDGWASSRQAWLHVGPDGTVTAATGKVECGQGTRSTLALLIARELRVRPDSVQVVMGDTGVSPPDAGTFGSRSMPDVVPLLRRAAAAARRVLRTLAAERFGLGASSLTMADGRVAGPDGAPVATYGQLVAGAHRRETARVDEEVTEASTWGTATWGTAANAAREAQGLDLVTGRKRFPSDLAVPGMRHGCVLREPAHGAVLRQLDPAAVAAVAGVLVVYEGEFAGVVAPTVQAARAAIATLASTADWEVPPAQPAQAELEEWLRSHPAPPGGPGTAYRQDARGRAGDVEAALAAGPIRLSATYTAAYIAHVPLEPRAALAQWNEGRLIVHVGTSTPFRARTELAAALELDEADVQVIVPDYGGGFGGKHGSVVALEAARLARAAGCPVKVQWSRDEEFRAGYLRPAAVIDVTSSADTEGRLTGWSFVNINSGPAGLAVPYRVDNWNLDFRPARSPLPQGSSRALAATANNFARESQIDEMALLVGEDPLRFRLRHLTDDRLAVVLRGAADRIGWGRCGELDDGYGIGLACAAEKDGRVATAASVRVAKDGTVSVLRLVTAFDCGAVVDPANLVNQIEGATVMGLGGALFEQVEFAGGRMLNASMTQYRVPRLPDVPSVEVILVNRPDLPSAGGGETPLIAVAPAIANAIRHAAGVRLRAMPLVPSGRVDK
jgi:CO/xanthine dehydrogenase Mo-binding subunit/aerobic-type carbon monoxide dehydrogenase small subunit (CoxS/CutS family)